MTLQFSCGAAILLPVVHCHPTLQALPAGQSLPRRQHVQAAFANQLPWGWAQARQGGWAVSGTIDAIEHLANGFPAWIRAGGACGGAGGTCLHGVTAAGWPLSPSSDAHPRRQRGEKQFCAGST